MTRRRAFCKVCDDQCIRVWDGDGNVWWEHVHSRHNDHKPVPEWDSERPPITLVDVLMWATIVILLLAWWVSR